MGIPSAYIYCEYSIPSLRMAAGISYTCDWYPRSMR